MAKTLSQIDQRFAYITQEAAQESEPETGVYFQELKMADETDAEGNRIFDDAGDVRQIPVDWDEAATNAVYDAWKRQNLGQPAGEGENSPEPAPEGGAGE